MSIIQTVTPVTHDLGAFQVRRALPSRQRTMVGPFIFVDQFGPAQLPPGKAMDVPFGLQTRVASRGQMSANRQSPSGLQWQS